MAGLSHFLNSTASTKYYEPMYPNLFEVTVLPPATVSGGSILIEHVTKIEGMATDTGGEMLEQKYKWATRSYEPIVVPTVVDLKISFSLNLDNGNSLYVYKTLRDWWRTAWNPLTGVQGIKANYTGTIVATQFTRKGDIFWQRTYHSVIPKGNLPELNGDYSASELLAFDGVEFRADWWEENIV